jgi:hypothetical protein
MMEIMQIILSIEKLDYQQNSTVILSADTSSSVTTDNL